MAAKKKRAYVRRAITKTPPKKKRAYTRRTPLLKSAAASKSTGADPMVKFVLRLDPKLHKQIKKDAKSNNTSMNREINNVLRGTGKNSPQTLIITKLDEILAKV